MNNLLKFLPQILESLPMVAKYLKYLPILMILAIIGYAVYYFATSYRDPYKCVDNEVYQQIRIDSGVYVFKGGYCVDEKIQIGSPKEK
jgi:sugar phosphate permease